MNNQSEDRLNAQNIQGEPLDLDILLSFAEIDELDVESAAEWWDKNASVDWVGALDSEPIDDGQ